MNRALWKKNFSESALLFLALAIGVAAFAWFRVHVVGELDTSTFQKIIGLLPKKLLNYTSVGADWLITYDGRTALTLDEPFLLMMIAIWGIVRGSDVVSGEISRGTMEMLLSQPVSRKQTFVIHTAVTMLGVLALVGITWLFMWISIMMSDVLVAVEPTSVWHQAMWPLSTLFPGERELVDEPMRNYIDAWIFMPGIVNLLFLGFFIAAVATLLSAFDRFRWRTLGIVIAIYMIAAMIKILGMSSETFDWTTWFTFFSLYEPELSIKLYLDDPSAFWQLMIYDEQGQWLGFGQFAHNLMLIGMTILFLWIAFWKFKRRDIPAPL